MVLLAFAALINLIIFLWLLVAAFTRSVLWGILVFLFSPITAIAFGISYYHEVKLPFLLYVASSVFVIFAFFSISQEEWMAVASRAGVGMPMEVEPAPQIGELSTNQSDQPGEVSSPAVGTAKEPSTPLPPAAESEPASGSGSATQEKPASQKAKSSDAPANFPPSHAQAREDPLQIKKQEQPKPVVSIKPHEVKKYLNRYLIVTMTNKVERCGLLKKVDDRNVYLQRRWVNDSVEYTIARAKIKTIQVLKEDTGNPCE